ncbi:MAG TPA: alpha/beta fold hydrolase [Kofleriaceae bacterium]|nr:alpha/beta fold hydrolase [Kofleriaceae bacterium]
MIRTRVAVAVLLALASCQSGSTKLADTTTRAKTVSAVAIDVNAKLATASEDVSFTSGGNAVPGTLVKPASGSGPYAAVVLMAGSGPTDRDWNSPLLPAKNGSAKLLAEALASHGMIVLRFDKAAVGGNKTPIAANTTFDVYRDEGQAALAYLRARADVAPGALFVAGHSEGGIHATRVALAEGGHIAGLVLLSAAGRSMMTVMMGQLESQMRSAMPLQADRELAALQKGFDDFLAGKAVDPKEVTSIAPLQQLVAAVVNPASATLARGLFAFDPAAALAKVNVPVFIYNGMRDIQVDPEKDAKQLASVKPDATLVLAPEADHVLKHETKSVAELRANLGMVQTNYNAEGRELDPTTVSALVEWLAKRTAP